MNKEAVEAGDNGLHYAPPDAIAPMALVEALSKLTFLSDDMYLRSQGYNLDIVDQFLMPIEYKVLGELMATDSTPPDTLFLLAQSQMWIFAAYELLRTWRQRANDIIKWCENGGLELKLKSLREKDSVGFHFGLKIRIEQIEKAIADDQVVKELDRQRRLIHIPFTRLEWLRVSLAKHEVKGKKQSPALMPGYARINTWCGSLEFELENGKYSMGYLSRRDVADSIRAMDFSREPPTDNDIAQFDDYMAGRNV